MHARIVSRAATSSAIASSSLLIDLARLDEIHRQSLPFGVNRARALFLPRTRSRRATAQICPTMPRAAAKHGIDLTGARVRLLCYPRLLGYAFKPAVSLILLCSAASSRSSSRRCATS
jgi:uncharacterized protein